MRLAARKLRPADEPVIPLVNIVLLLLIFFLLSGTLTEVEPVPVTPPVAARGEPEGDRALTIWIGADGQMALGNGPITGDHLLAHLADRFAGTGDSTVTLIADEAAEAAIVVALASRLRQAGATSVTLITRRGTQ